MGIKPQKWILYMSWKEPILFVGTQQPFHGMEKIGRNIKQNFQKNILKENKTKNEQKQMSLGI